MGFSLVLAPSKIINLSILLRRHLWSVGERGRWDGNGVPGYLFHQRHRLNLHYGPEGELFRSGRHRWELRGQSVVFLVGTQGLYCSKGLH